MGLLAEGFTVLAVLEARDKASEIYDKVQARVEKFSGSMKAAADVATESGAKIDESFLQTASGADALDLASARVEAAQGKLAAATKAQADAERALLEEQAKAAGAADGDTEAMKRQITAADALAKAQKNTADATRGLKDAEATQAAIADASAKSVDDAAVKTKSSHDGLSSAASTIGKVGLGMVFAGGLFVKSAADFQSSTSVLSTSGGETAAELDKARQGILNLSGATGTSTKELTGGLYMLGSAGFDVAHGGLQALQSAAQGAKAENADLGTVSNALSTILTDYGIKVANNAQGQKAANAVMDQMIAVVQNGKTTTEDLAGSLSAVLPVASSAGLSFAQVGGAMATMTGQGMSAQQSAQDLASTIGALQNPNAVAVKEMQALGLNANDVQKSLGTKGLTGTIAELTGAITSHMGPSGLVLQSAFKSSAAAAQDADTMISKMPTNLQRLAKSYMDGSVTAKDWKKDLQGLDPISQHLMQQFASTADKTHSFNDLLAAGGPAAQTYNAALSKMLNGSTGLTTALMLGGPNMQTFQSNVTKVGDAAKGAGSNVDGWKQIQGNFNQKLSEAKYTVEATGISIGTALLPAVTNLVDKIMGIIKPIAAWIEKHQGLTKEIFLGITAVALLVGGINIAVKAFTAIKGAIDAVGSVVKGVGKLFGLFKGDTEAAGAAADATAGEMQGLAAAEDETAVATDGATVSADASSTSWLRSGASALLAAGRFLIVKTAQLAVTVATKAWTAAQWLFNAAMEANPIMLVVGAIIALGIAVYEAYQHFAGFRDLVKTVWDWLKNAVVDVIDFVKDHWKLIVEIISGPMGLAVKFVIDHWNDIKKWFSQGIHDVEAILKWFESLPGKFTKWLSDTAASVGRGVDSVAKWFAGLPGRVTSAISNFFSGLGSWFSDKIGQASSAVGNKVDSILQWFKDLPGKILNAVANFGTLLLNAGEDLVKGLINGVENMASSAIQSVENLGSSLVSGIGNMLGISSPSKVMADQVGKFIPAGIAKGIQDNAGVLRQALTGAANLTISATRSSLSAPALAAAIPATSSVGNAGAGGGSVHFHFEGARIMNERDMDVLVNKMGGALGKRILPSGGLNLAM